MTLGQRNRNPLDQRRELGEFAIVHQLDLEIDAGERSTPCRDLDPLERLALPAPSAISSTTSEAATSPGARTAVDDEGEQHESLRALRRLRGGGERRSETDGEG